MKTSGTVAVAGPKFCGKTTTSRRFDASSYALNTKDKIELVQSSPLSILSSATPRLIDEWQNFSELWNCARPEVDNREQKFGLFIFTESSTPADEEDIYHSGAGRIVTLPMRLMSLYESNESIGQVSLSALFNKSKNVFSLPMMSTVFRIQHSIYAEADGHCLWGQTERAGILNGRHSVRECIYNRRRNSHRAD